MTLLNKIKQLSPRLAHLLSLTDFDYDHIYDLCCDHGHLGIHAHQHSRAKVTLVDQVDSIIADIKDKFSYLQDGRLQFVCGGAENICIEPDKKVLIVLAGVGGQVAKAIIAQILLQFQD